MSAWILTGPCLHSLCCLILSILLAILHDEKQHLLASYKWGLGTLQREVQAKVKSPVPLYECFRGVPSAHALGTSFLQLQ